MDVSHSSPVDRIELQKWKGVRVSSVVLWYSFLTLYGSCIIFALRHYVPIWDGWAFYKDCFMKTALTGDCDCYGHTSFLPTLLYGGIAYLFPYNFTVQAAINFAMGLAACYVLARALSPLFPAGDWLCHAAVSVLILNPVMFAQAIQPNLDFPLAILTAFALAAFLAGDLMFATLLGVLMTLTKDPGIMLYGMLLIGFIGARAIALTRTSGLKSAMAYAAENAYTVLPLFLFLLYAQLFGLHGGSFGKSELSLADVAQKLVDLFPDGDLSIAQMASLFVLNFSWVLTAIVLAGVASMICGRDWLAPQARQWLAVILVALVGSSYFHTRVLLWNNPRYVLPLYVLLLGGAVIVVARIRTTAPRIAVSGVLVLVALLVGSHFYTIDPLSKLTFGTIKFGTHDMLTTGGFRRLPEHGGYGYYGRDQLVYNLQFIKFSELAEEAIQRFGPQARYVAGPVFTGWDDFRHFDEFAQTRSMKPGAHPVDYFTYDEIARGATRIGEQPFVYLEFPNVRNGNALAQLRRDFPLIQTHLLSRGGYSITAYEFGSASTTTPDQNAGRR